MQVRAALMMAEGADQPLVVDDVELDDPAEFEVLIDLKACGVCHSDDHIRTGDLPLQRLPYLMGHEGAGVVERVGPGVSHVQVGDHVCTSFIPSCGYCKWCASGRMYLCDNGAMLLAGHQMDGTFRFHTNDGRDIAQMCMLGEFATKTVVPEVSVVKIPRDIPFEHACLLSCGVVTGWGSATVRAGIKPGDTAVVWGVGGVGANAVQGAAHAGARRIFAIDVNDFKLEQAMLFGATDVINAAERSIDEILEPIHSTTNGQGVDVCVLCTGVVSAETIGHAFRTIAKDGALVITGASPWTVTNLPISPTDLTMSNKSIKGSVYGSMNPRHAIPHLIRMYESGQLKLDELITRRYGLDDINDAFADMLGGRNVRGVLVYE